MAYRALEVLQLPINVDMANTYNAFHMMKLYFSSNGLRMLNSSKGKGKTSKRNNHLHNFNRH